jgi:hypothetical protein
MTTNNKDIVVVADMSADSKLWHLRLGHMSEKRDESTYVKGETTGVEVS